MKTARYLTFVIILFCSHLAMMGQVSAEIIEILQKCEAKMDNPKGLELNMDMHAGMLVFSLNGTIKMYSKGEKTRMRMTMKALGREFIEESCYDGEQEWIYKQKMKKNGADSLIIKKTNKRSKGDYDIDMDIYKDYKQAKMKLSGKYYEITFTKPIDKESPKKAVMKIDKDTYYFRELTCKQSGVSMRMTLTKVKVGVNDAVFKFDPSQYPSAVVVKK